MTTERKPKKSDVLEIRLAHETKRSLMERARSEGRTTSEVVRGFIDVYLAAPVSHQRPLETAMIFLRSLTRPAFAILAGAAGAAALAIAITPAAAWPDLRATFEHLDADGDGTLRIDEFLSQTRAAQPLPNTVPAPDQAALAVPLEGEGSGDRVFFAYNLPAGGAVSDELFLAPIPGSEHSTEDLAMVAGREFDGIDADASGTLSFDEFFAHHARVAGGAFEAIDANKDGSLDAADLTKVNSGVADAATIIAHFDADKNGLVSRDEFVAAN